MTEGGQIHEICILQIFKGVLKLEKITKFISVSLSSYLQGQEGHVV